MHYLQKAFDQGKLCFVGKTEHIGTSQGFSQLKNKLWAKDWVVYSKKPFGGPQHLLDYLGRYTHRVAIANHRIINVEKGKVSFTYRDRKNNDTLKVMNLQADEFIRRFLLHVLPDDFMRIRHFGFLANRSKNKLLSRCRQLLGLSPQITKPSKKTPQELILELTGFDLNKCPCCEKGTMKIIAQIPKYSGSCFNDVPGQPKLKDSS